MGAESIAAVDTAEDKRRWWGWAGVGRVRMADAAERCI